MTFRWVAPQIFLSVGRVISVMVCSITQMGMVRGEVFMLNARLWVGQRRVMSDSPLVP